MALTDENLELVKNGRVGRGGPRADIGVKLEMKRAEREGEGHA